LQRKDSEATTMLYSNIVAVIGNAPVLATAGPHSLEAAAWLPGVLVFGPLGMYAGIVALKRASASTLGPYTLLRLVFAVAGGLVVFHEIPDLTSLGGATLILTACALSSGVRAPRVILKWKARLARFFLMPRKDEPPGPSVTQAKTR
jgi:drug/metabolite transporter (DMT)-like permease